MPSIYLDVWECFQQSSGVYRPQLYLYSSASPWPSDGVYGLHYKLSNPLFVESRYGSDCGTDICLHLHNTYNFDIRVVSAALSVCAMDSGGLSFVEDSSGSLQLRAAVNGKGVRCGVQIRVTADGGQSWTSSGVHSFEVPSIGESARDYADSHHRSADSSGKAEVYDSNKETVGYAYYTLTSPATLYKVTDINDKILWSSSDATVNMNCVGDVTSGYRAIFGRSPFGDTTQGYSVYTGNTLQSNRHNVSISDCPRIPPGGDAFIHLSADIQNFSPSDLSNFGLLFNLDPNSETAGLFMGSTFVLQPASYNNMWVLQEVDDGNGNLIKQWTPSQLTHILQQSGSSKVWT